MPVSSSVFRRFMAVLALVGVLVALVRPVHAQGVVYTFEEPIFSFGDETPFGPTPPNINNGLPGFTTEFISDSFPDNFDITNTANFPANSLMQNQFLASLNGTQLVLVFSSPINFLSFDFALNSDPDDGSIVVLGGGDGDPQFFSAQDLGDGGLFPGGTVTVFFDTPVDAVLLAGTLNDESPTQFAIDNLAVASAPEPASLVLVLSAGMVTVVAVRRKK